MARVGCLVDGRLSEHLVPYLLCVLEQTFEGARFFVPQMTLLGPPIDGADVAAVERRRGQQLYQPRPGSEEPGNVARVVFEIEQSQHLHETPTTGQQFQGALRAALRGAQHDQTSAPR